MRFRNIHVNRQPKFMIIPMIDVVFFLLIFFMMNSMQTMTQRAMSVQLPQASSAEAQTQMPIVITVDAVGHIMVDGKSMSFADAAAFFKEKAATNPNLAVVLQADKTTMHGQVAAVMDMLKTAGVKKLGIAAEKKG